jgi:MMP 1-O-methyltransferase
MQPSIDIETVKGFLDPEEGRALYSYALECGARGPVLEVGSYCGKSTVYLGEACRERRVSLYAIDHHRGSEEHQPGEEYHDQELFDGKAGLMDTFREFRQTMRDAALEEVVVPIVASSLVASRNWHTPLGMVFIDGGHSREAAQADYRSWASHVITGGILAIHDIFPDPAEGGQAPYEILKLAIASGLFVEVDRVKTLGVLRRL